MVRVVHCDDSRAYRELVRVELEDDAEITIVGEAADLASTLRLVDELRPDVVLLDLVDPDGSAVRAIKDAGVPVVILSGHPPEFGDRAGVADGYVEKGAPISELREVLLRVGGG